MEPVDHTEDRDVRRMELRGMVRLASEVIAQYWPMRTFVHHNPLHSLEYLPFEEAVRRGREFLGGQGFLPGDVYRSYLRAGRIRLAHLKTALDPLVCDKHIDLGTCRITHGEVLLACLTHGLCAPEEEPVGSLVACDQEDQVCSLADHLAPALRAPDVRERMNVSVPADRSTLGGRVTLASWCDRTLGTQIVEQINGELIKWCEAFSDEGHATWAMPGRERGFYGTWKFLAEREWSPCGIADSRRKIARLPEHPEDAMLESLEALGIPRERWQDYFSLQLAALPGWAGFMKWRAEAGGYDWQQAYPVGLVKYLAVRLWYERELVEKACREELGIEGSFPALSAYMQDHPFGYFLRKERTAGRLSEAYTRWIDRLRQDPAGRTDERQWETLAARYQAEVGLKREQAARRAAARRLISLLQALEIAAGLLLETSPEDLMILIKWIESFPEREHGPIWLKAFEWSYQEQLFATLKRNIRPVTGGPGDRPGSGGAADPAAPEEGGARSSMAVRPHSQSVFCIDVRSEPFRRHLEAAGANETYGFAGFFAAFIRYRAWESEHETDQFPMIMRAKNVVMEIPRTYRDQFSTKYRSRAKLIHAGHTLLHDLKENVVTPYVMVESLGWFYAMPIVGKTVLPRLYKRWTDWLRRRFVPPMATTLTVDKLAPAEIEEMVVSEQRAIVRAALRERLELHGPQVVPEFVEALRSRALNGDAADDPFLTESARRMNLTNEQVTAFIDVLRKEYRIDGRWASAQKERITRTGFTLDEQVLTADTALRMMGLTKGFARLVLFCAHGSTTENNPFESALDCGACGGNEGKPNARVLAAIANNPQVRLRLAKNGIKIPSDTHFLAGQVDTTTDDVQLFDLEDVPPTHRKDVARLLADLREAGRLTSQERCSRLPDVQTAPPLRQAEVQVRRRSADWSQVRPEWGLSGNTSFIVGRREITKGLDLAGRVFLHSYDYREDPTDRLLEVLMTAPQVVAQWINMEHYFSTVDNEVYGAGTKIYHNVVGRLGIMSGPWSDLRLGLAWQTVMNGTMPYHEPMRLLTIIEAPRPRIEKLIGRHEVLQHFYHHEWVHLVALEPEERVLYRYQSAGRWMPVAG